MPNRQGKRALRPALSAEERRQHLHAGIEYFNDGRYFEAHEEWEEIWRSTTPEPRELFRGLIQVAVGLHHYLARDKPGPARRVLARGLRRLEPLAQCAEGLDLEGLRASARRWEAWLGDPGAQPQPGPPRLELVRSFPQTPCRTTAQDDDPS